MRKQGYTGTSWRAPEVVEMVHTRVEHSPHCARRIKGRYAVSVEDKMVEVKTDVYESSDIASGYTRPALRVTTYRGTQRLSRRCAEVSETEEDVAATRDAGPGAIGRSGQRLLLSETLDLGWSQSECVLSERRGHVTASAPVEHLASSSTATAHHPMLTPRANFGSSCLDQISYIQYVHCFVAEADPVLYSCPLLDLSVFASNQAL